MALPPVRLNLSDKDILQASYMPFVQNGGLFVSSQQRVSLGQELLVIASLPHQPSSFPLPGKVIWTSPRGYKIPGFAIQLSTDPKSLEFKNTAERILAGSLESEKSTFTM